jgi:hypothetical protein
VKDFISDDPETELIFRDILRKLKPLQNGDAATFMAKRGLIYKVSFGASVIALQQLALNYEKNHIHALKLWNKQWRETMILATLLEEPDKVTGKQMDYWVKNFQTAEIAAQVVMNLFSKTGIVLEKACEYCRWKNTLVRES